MTTMRFTEDQDTIEYARRQWEDGAARMERFTHDSNRRVVLEHVVEGLSQEVQRRIGQSFESIELVDVWRGAERWATQVVHERAPEDPWAWELDIVLDATFHRFARRASDWEAW